MFVTGKFAQQKKYPGRHLIQIGKDKIYIAPNKAPYLQKKAISITYYFGRFGSWGGVFLCLASPWFLRLTLVYISLPSLSCHFKIDLLRSFTLICVHWPGTPGKGWRKTISPQ